MSTPSVFRFSQQRYFSEDVTSELAPGQRFSVKHRSPDGSPLQPTDTLYVGNMQFDTTEEDLYNYFTTIGDIKGVKIIMDPKGLSKG